MQLGLQVVDELARGATRPAGVLALPQERPRSHLLLGQRQPAAARQGGGNGEVALLVRRGEGHAQSEAGGQRDLLLHTVPAMHVVARRTTVGEALTDEIAPVGGGIDEQVGRARLGCPLQ